MTKNQLNMFMIAAASLILMLYGIKIDHLISFVMVGSGGVFFLFSFYAALKPFVNRQK
ncbi:hypothetical protein VIOR103205_09065 [Vibrio ordalii]|uniref:hypothetical protein n=1 Tax=Vibrio ordalii TaxID=28174 RepID=UPI00030BBE02|nr:hypothetical protein [Vibrio ordalii]